MPFIQNNLRIITSPIQNEKKKKMKVSTQFTDFLFFQPGEQLHVFVHEL